MPTVKPKPSRFEVPLTPERYEQLGGLSDVLACAGATLRV